MTALTSSRVTVRPAAWSDSRKQSLTPSRSFTVVPAMSKTTRSSVLGFSTPPSSDPVPDAELQCHACSANAGDYGHVRFGLENHICLFRMFGIDAMPARADLQIRQQQKTLQIRKDQL